jgi:zinc transport system substrate-binding protein
MKKITLILLVIISLGLTACTSSEDDSITVVTTLFPQYSMVEALAPDEINHVYILPFGASAHTFEPTPGDVATILDANLLIYTGEIMEGWVHDIEEAKPASLRLLDLSRFVDLIEGDDHDHDHDADHDEHEHEEEAHTEDNHEDHDADHDHDEEMHTEEDHDDHDHGSVDPHYWLDPHNLEEMAQAIADALIVLVPDQASAINANLAAYLEDIEAYEEATTHMILNAPVKTVLHGGHNAFAYFTSHYGLTYQTPYSGFSDDVEPTAQSIAQLIDAVDLLGTSVIFAEEFIQPNVANAIAEATGVVVVQLFTGGNISEDLYNEGWTLLDILYENNERLREGLYPDECSVCS